MSSARWSAAETKFAGPLSETCRFATSPKSRFRLRPALRAAAIITLSKADWAGKRDSGRRGERGCEMSKGLFGGADSGQGTRNQLGAMSARLAEPVARMKRSEIRGCIPVRESPDRAALHRAALASFLSQRRPLQFCTPLSPNQPVLRRVTVLIAPALG